MLESEGLVASQPGKGTRVAELSPEEALHVDEIRVALEALAGCSPSGRRTSNSTPWRRRSSGSATASEIRRAC